MSILNGFKKARAYKKTDDGYIWESRDVHGETVYFNDNDTAEIKLGAINGITSDPSAEADDIAASAALVKQLNNSLEEQPQFVYDENGQITGYTTKIGGADTVFPFINDDILVCARLQPTNSQETAFSVGNFKIPSDGVYKIYFVSSTSYWSSGTVTIGNDIAFEIPTYNNYTAGNHIFEEERECKTGEEINIISQVIAGTLCILLYKIT